VELGVVVEKFLTLAGNVAPAVYLTLKFKYLIIRILGFAYIYVHSHKFKTLVLLLTKKEHLQYFSLVIF
jgi:hypothetical protein